MPRPDLTFGQSRVRALPFRAFPSALIAGASIAGPALAYWLERYGWRTTIVERAPSLGTGGQNVDLKRSGAAGRRTYGA
ncbi:hypothetical protein ACHMXB_05660 [Arthrobacter sp. UC242_113]|uniref:hypothetical protein n=1 Tax=Arthrobacter sp. UC242_113 TaxID=3374550 RepID=UPI003757B396